MRESNTKGFYWRWGQAMYQYRWIVVALWVFLFAGFVFLAPKSPDIFKENGFTPYGTESDIGTKQLKDEFGFPASTLTIVYKSEQIDLTKPEEKQNILSSLERLKQLPYVAGLEWNPATRREGTGHVQAVMISLNLNENEVIEKFPEIRGTGPYTRRLERVYYRSRCTISRFPDSKRKRPDTG